MGRARTLLASGDALTAALLSGDVWGRKTVSWSDPDSPVDYGFGYGGRGPSDGFGQLGAAQLASVRFALDGGGGTARAGFSVEGFTGLGLDYAGSGRGSADIRVANSRDPDTAYAYTPGAGTGGDAWFGGSGRAPRPGNYDHMTVLHELGHALGLKHTHEGRALPMAWDTPEFTVMTYRAYQGAAASGYRFGDCGAPQTYMQLDIAALQEMYGADFETNAGNTVYAWRPGSGRTFVDGEVAIAPAGNRIFATVWDGGGRDTYDLSAYGADLEVDLRPGAASTFSRAQLADLGGGPNGGNARGNIFNALLYRGDGRSLIENATGGTGDDRICGNAGGNRLVGGDGDDRLAGFASGDMLVGGRGDDVFVFRSVEASPYGRMDVLRAGAGARAFEAPGRGDGDLIDLRGIDADEGAAGNQAFAFGGLGRGHLWLIEIGSTTWVCGNVDRNPDIDLKIGIDDGAVRASAYGEDDFLL